MGTCVIAPSRPAPKPRAKAKRPRKPTTRTKIRCGAGSTRRGKSSFPKQRDRKYTTWLVTENECLLTLCRTKLRISSHDFGGPVLGWHHCCWGPVDPAHVGKHRSKGAPDFGCTVPLCRAAHDFYDQHRAEWRRATGYSEKKMASAASGFALKYVERGVVPTTQGDTP